MTLFDSTPIVSDAVDPWIGLALIGGLFFAYYIQRRNARLRRDATARLAVAPAAVAAPLPAAEPAAETAGVDAASSASAAPIAESEAQSGTSPSFAISFVYTALLIAAATHRDSWWGWLWQGLFGALFVLALVTTFARGDYEAARAKAPALTRREHMLMNGVPFVLLPLVGWVLVIPFGWIWGAIVPGVIWLVPLGLGIAIEAVEAIRGPRS